MWYAFGNSLWLVRVIAFLIDWLYLSLLGLCLGEIFQERFFSLGVKGLVLGCVFTYMYFAFFDSRLGGGQTFGKRLCRIKVIDSNKKELSFFHAFIRAFICTTPLLLCGNQFTPTFSSLLYMKIYSVVYWMIVAGVPACQLYLLVFQHLTIHDLCLNTCVVDYSLMIEYRPVQTLSYGILGIIIMTSLLSGIALSNRTYNQVYFTYYPLVREVYNTHHYTGVRLLQADKQSLSLEVFPKSTDDASQIYTEVISLIAENNPNPQLQIDITSVRTYNIGVYKGMEFPSSASNTLSRWQYHLNYISQLPKVSLETTNWMK